jgi:hypothetical protein
MEIKLLFVIFSLHFLVFAKSENKCGTAVECYLQAVSEINSERDELRKINQELRDNLAKIQKQKEEENIALQLEFKLKMQTIEETYQSKFSELENKIDSYTGKYGFKEIYSKCYKKECPGSPNANHGQTFCCCDEKSDIVLNSGFGTEIQSASVAAFRHVVNNDKNCMFVSAVKSYIIEILCCPL